MRFGYLLESPRRGDSSKYMYTKRMFYEKMFKSIRYSCFRRVLIKFPYNSKFGFTAKPLVTNTVVIKISKSLPYNFQRKHSSYNSNVKVSKGLYLIMGYLF